MPGAILRSEATMNCEMLHNQTHERRYHIQVYFLRALRRHQ